jgi:MFS transporter, DHA1 family, inner membrane transport protein
MPRLLYLLSFANLVIGSGAFVIGGILEPMAASLGVSVPVAGQAMTAYAIATALLAPMLLIATGGWARRNALLLALGIFALGNGVCALAPDLATLLLGRLLMGTGAAFTAIAAGIAVALVPPARRGKALALVFLGFSLNYVVGLPLGAWAGLRFGWRVPVLAVALITVALMGWLAWRVPASLQAPGAGFRGLGRALRQRAVIAPLALTLLYFTAIFLVFTYIGPVLQALVPMSSEALSGTIALFGVAGAAGTLFGGWANDRFGARASLVASLTTIAFTMLALPLVRGNWPAMMALFMAWGLAGFSIMAPQQSRLAGAAPEHAPMLLSLNTSMLYFGMALGAAVGGAASLQIGFHNLPWAGVPFVLAGLLTLALPGASARVAVPVPIDSGRRGP